MSGVPAPADLIITGVILACAIAGASRGFISSASSLGGFVIGLIAASRLAGRVLPHTTTDPTIMVWSIVSAVVVAFAAAAICEAGAAALRRRMQRRPTLVAIDRIAGALIAAVLGIGIVWVVAGAIVGSARFVNLRPTILASSIVPRINHMFPSSSHVLGFIARYDPLPTFRGPNISDIPLPGVQVAGEPAVRGTAGSVVRVVGEACGYQVTGSGWVASPHRIVTNAHVVAGESQTSVQIRGVGRAIPARVIWFDADNDIAILDAPGVEASPLPIRSSVPAADRSAAMLGFPENGPFTIRSARIGLTRDVRTTDITDTRRVVRSVTAFRGVVRHGNSGGPLLNSSGEVVGTVFAAAVDDVEGGYAIPTSVVLDAISRETTVSVSTGPCV